jgi:hypothetical protein
VVGFFMFDDNTNQQTDLGLCAGRTGSFIHRRIRRRDSTALIEVHTAGSDTTTVDQRLQIPNWPSSDALILFMLQ